MRKTVASGWGISSFPISVSTIYNIIAAGYTNNNSNNRAVITIIDNNPNYQILLSAASNVDGMGYVVFGKA